MNSSPNPASALRNLSTEELLKVGEDSLRQRLVEQATFAHFKYRPLTADKLETLLADPDCVRYPTRLVFEFGEMAMHQFAQPDLDWRKPEENGRVLYLRPSLRERPDLLLIAIAYMLPVLNYGEQLITDDHCLHYGAALLGMLQEEFYEQVCALADFAGCEIKPRLADDCVPPSCQ